MVLISSHGTLNNGRQQTNRGFTLIEMMVVLVLIGIIMGVAVPRIFHSAIDQAREEALHFSGVLQWLLDRGAFSGERHFLHIDLDKQQYRCLVQRENSLTEVAEPLLKPRSLDEKGVVVGWMPEGRYWIESSEAVVGFDAFGSDQSVLVTFMTPDEKNGYSVLLMRTDPRPRILKGVLGWDDIEHHDGGIDHLVW